MKSNWFLRNVLGIAPEPEVPVSFVPPSDESIHVETVYVGTTAELLASLKEAMNKEEEQKVFEPEPDFGCEQDVVPITFEDEYLEPEPEVVLEQETMEDNKEWLSLEYLKLALQIEESKAQKTVFYIDVGNLPKLKSEEYIKALMDKYKGNAKNSFWLPRRNSDSMHNKGTEVVTLPGAASLEAVLETAAKLREFAKN